LGAVIGLGAAVIGRRWPDSPIGLAAADAAGATSLAARQLLGAWSNGLTAQGITSFWQNIVQGALLVVAVVIQQRWPGERAVKLPR